MKKEDFIKLGLTEEQAEKAAKASTEELKGFIPKTRFDEVNEVKKQLETDIKTRDDQIENLKKDAGTSEDLKKQIEQLQKDNKETSEKYQKEMNDIKLNNAIKLALVGKTHDEDIAAGLFDKSKLILGDDGKVTGLDDQLKELKESKSYLFKEEEKIEDKPGFQIGGKPPTGGAGGDEKPSLKDALTARLQQNKN